MAAHSSLRAGYNSALRINASEVFEMLSPNNKRGCWWIHIWDHDPYNRESREALLLGILAAKVHCYLLNPRALWSTVLIWGSNPSQCHVINKMVDRNYWLVNDKNVDIH